MTISKSKITKRKIPVDYTKKGFSEIKEDLKGYIKRYYPETYQDFNKSSFGSMMLDLVSYVGDQLHYYIDHNANESNPVFAKEAENVFQGLISLGQKPTLVNTTLGYVDAYFPVPSDLYSIGLDSNYLFTCNAGSTFMTQGGNVFTQKHDVVISPDTSEIVGHRATDDGSKIDYFLLKTKIPVESGEVKTVDIEIGDARKFLKLEIPDATVTEIIKIVDSDDREYFQVDNLSNDNIMKPVVDTIGSDSLLKTRMKRSPVPRRFTFERSLEKSYVNFGNGSDSDLSTNSMVDPAKPVIKNAAKTHVSSPRQNPYNLIASKGLGVAPENTTISITYRSNTNENSNAAVGTVNQVVDPIIVFQNEQLLDSVKVKYIKENIQVYNEEPINGYVSITNTEELKHRYIGNYSAQGRAVTMDDYVNSVYSMPASYGAIKRAAIVKDNNDFRRNLNLYLISEGADEKLQAPSMLLKQNVKTWLDSMRMVSDSVDIFDAHVLNLGLDIKVKVTPGANAQTLLSTIKNRVYEELMTVLPDIGEPFYISEVFRILRTIPEVVSVPQRDGVVVRNLVGSGKYTDYSYDIPENLSTDESMIYIPQNTIWEIKYSDDIRGTIIT